MRLWLDHKQKVQRLANKYEALINDPVYKEILADLFQRKIIERTEQLKKARAKTIDETVLLIANLQGQIEVFENLLYNPKKYLDEWLKIQNIEASGKVGDGNGVQEKG